MVSCCPTSDTLTRSLTYSLPLFHCSSLTHSLTHAGVTRSSQFADAAHTHSVGVGELEFVVRSLSVTVCVTHALTHSLTHSLKLRAQHSAVTESSRRSE